MSWDSREKKSEGSPFPSGSVDLSGLASLGAVESECEYISM